MHILSNTISSWSGHLSKRSSCHPACGTCQWVTFIIMHDSFYVLYVERWKPKVYWLVTRKVNQFSYGVKLGWLYNLGLTRQIQLYITISECPMALNYKGYNCYFCVEKCKYFYVTFKCCCKKSNAGSVTCLAMTMFAFRAYFLCLNE